MAQVAEGLLAAAPESLVLVAGDLNDSPAAATLRPLLSSPRLADPAAFLPASGAYTYTPLRHRGRLDYLLVSRNGLDWIADVEVVAGDDVEAASDHRPVLVELEVPPQARAGEDLSRASASLGPHPALVDVLGELAVHGADVDAEPAPQ